MKEKTKQKLLKIWEGFLKFSELMFKFWVFVFKLIWHFILFLFTTFENYVESQDQPKKNKKPKKKKSKK